MQIFTDKLYKGLFPTPNIKGFYGTSNIVYSQITSIILQFIIISLLVLIIYSSIKTPTNILGNALKILKKFCFYCFIFFVFFITAIQTIEHAKYFKYLSRKFSGKTYSQREDTLSLGLYPLSKDIIKNLGNGRLTGKLQTNFNVSPGEELTFHVYLCYYLYPTINIRSHNNKNIPDCLIIFDKTNPGRYVPKNYKIINIRGDKIILAIKKDINGNF